MSPLTFDEPKNLLLLLYDDLRALAGQYLRRERKDHTLQATALVHEAYLRMSRTRRDDWTCKEHFHAGAALMMRRILVDHARATRATKRSGGDDERAPLRLSEEISESTGIDVLALDEALVELKAIDSRKAAVVELKFFAGLDVEEISKVLHTSRRTTEREWTFARAWLRERITCGDRR